MPLLLQKKASVTNQLHIFVPKRLHIYEKGYFPGDS